MKTAPSVYVEAKILDFMAQAKEKGWVEVLDSGVYLCYSEDGDLVSTGWDEEAESEIFVRYAGYYIHDDAGYISDSELTYSDVERILEHLFIDEYNEV